MGKDLRISRPLKAYERFLVYSSDTSNSEILNHTAKPTGSFRAYGVGDAVYTRDEFGNVVKSFKKNDVLETTDKIKLKCGDKIYNTYAKEIYFVEDWTESEEEDNLEFSVRPSITKRIRVRGGFNG